MYKPNGAKFTLFTNMVNYTTARKTCNNMGAHLAVYTGLEEQSEVEQFFINQVQSAKEVM